MIRPDDGPSDVSVYEALHKLRCVKKEDSKNQLLSISKTTMRYKHSFPDSKKAANVLRLGTRQYATMLAAKERS